MMAWRKGRIKKRKVFRFEFSRKKKVSNGPGQTRIWNRHHLVPKKRAGWIIAEIESRLRRELTEKEVGEIRKTRKVFIHMHLAWNTLFDRSETVCPWEAAEKIKRWSLPDLSDFRMSILDSFTEKEKIAFCILFGPSATPRTALKIIELFWMPPSGILKKVFWKL